MDEILERLKKIEAILEGRVTTSKEVMTTSELTDYLGVNMSYIYKMTMNRDIPFYKPAGKRLYFKKTEIDEWISKHRRKTMDEIRDEAGEYMRKNRKKF